ncbi:portal protein [Desulfobaculum sp.]
MPLGKIGVKTALKWVSDAQFASRNWRAESWRDQEMYDGDQFTEEDFRAFAEKGIDPIPVNRTFPAVNLLLGQQSVNRLDIQAKGRTQADSELSEVMTECIKFVMDQSQGQFKVGTAFRDSIVAGVGFLAPGFSLDPRRERVRIALRDWKEIWWDPFSDPWLEPESCRYMFHRRWMDLEDLQAVFPDKAQELKENFSDLAGSSTAESTGLFDDEATLVEEERRSFMGSQWADSRRKRVRPVELWYPVYERCLFALFADGRAIEVGDGVPPNELVRIVNTAQELVPAMVRKMRTMTFLGKQVLQDMPSPYPHDQYPLVPFVAYTDRFGFPYGVPRQIRPQDEEVNIRRSVGLALLKTRRVMVEEGATEDLEGFYEEANKLDGFMVVAGGALREGRVRVEENAGLVTPQVALLNEAEKEIQQISGANDEQLGYSSNATSGKAIERRQMQGATITAPLFSNYRRSLHRLGTQLYSLIQGSWTGEKVLRVTDRLTKAERFVTVNERVTGASGPQEVKNNITQGTYDIIISDQPATDTIREQNLNLIIEWVKKSPPEVIPALMGMAFEMSNLPNKEQLLAKIKPMLGGIPGEEDMSPEEVKASVMQQLEQQKALQAQAAQLEQAKAGLEVEKLRLDIEEQRAKIAETLAAIQNARSKEEREAVKDGVDVARRVLGEQGGQP